MLRQIAAVNIMANIMIYIAGFGACGELLPSALLLVALLTGLVGCVLLADRVSGRLLASAAECSSNYSFDCLVR